MARVLEEPSKLVVVEKDLAFRQECRALWPVLRLHPHLLDPLLTRASLAAATKHFTSAEAELYRYVKKSGYNFECRSAGD